MLFGLDLGFGFTKSVCKFGSDAFPSVVADWTPNEVTIGGGFDRKDLDALMYQGRQYVIGVRALKVSKRPLVGLNREWLTTVPYQLLALQAIRRRVRESGGLATVITGLPVDDLAAHSATVKRQLEGTHKVEVLPEGTPWEITIQEVRVLPQPLGTVFSQVMDDTGVITDASLADARLGVLDIGFRTSDYFTLHGFEVIPGECLTRNSGMAELTLDVSREIGKRYGVEIDPHAMNDSVLRRTVKIADKQVDISATVDSLLDRHADAIAAHARMLWGDQARSLEVLWLTGGGAQLLGARLQQIAPHAKLVANSRIQNALGYYRFGCRLSRQPSRS